MDNFPTCIICLERLSDPPEGRQDDVNIVGSNGPHKVSTAVPCGHVYHQDCIQKWYCSGSNKKCPTCNVPIQQCIPLFLDSSVFGGGGIGEDDDVSLSSAEDEMDEVDCDNVGGDDDDREEVDTTNEGKRDEDLVQSETSATREKSTPFGVSADDAIEVLDSDSEEESVVAAAAARQTPQSTSSKKNWSIERLTKIAKHHKRRSVQFQTERKKQQERIAELQQQLHSKEAAVSRLTKANETAASKEEQLENKCSRYFVALNRVSAARDSLEEEKNQLRDKMKIMSSQLENLKKCHQQDLDNASGKSLPEYRQMRERIQELEREVEGTRKRLRVQRCQDSQSQDQKMAPRGRSELVRAFSLETSNKRQKSHGPQQRKADNPTVNSSRYSSNAARLMSASSSQQERHTKISAKVAAMRNCSLDDLNQPFPRAKKMMIRKSFLGPRFGERANSRK